MTTRVLVVGTGFGARVVAPAFAAVEECEVVAVVSPRDDVAAAVDAHRPDLVTVHSPPFLHRDHVVAAARAGAAVLCDKPCTPSAAQTAELLDEVVGLGVPHFVNFEFRHDPSRVELRRLVRAGGVGAVRTIEWTHHSSGSIDPLRPWGWLFDRALGGGWIGAWASHAIDTLHWLLDEPVRVIRSVPRTDIEFRPDRFGAERVCTAEDGLVAELRSESGVHIAIDSSFASPEPHTPRLVVSGDAGAVTVVGDRRVDLAGPDRVVTWEPATERSGSGRADRHSGPMNRWAAVVVDEVRGRDTETDVPTLVDGLAVDRVLDALRAG